MGANEIKDMGRGERVRKAAMGWSTADLSMTAQSGIEYHRSSPMRRGEPFPKILECRGRGGV